MQANQALARDKLKGWENNRQAVNTRNGSAICDMRSRGMNIFRDIYDTESRDGSTCVRGTIINVPDCDNPHAFVCASGGDLPI